MKAHRPLQAEPAALGTTPATATATADHGNAALQEDLGLSGGGNENAWFDVWGVYYPSVHASDPDGLERLGWSLTADIEGADDTDAFVAMLEETYGANAPLHELPYAMELWFTVCNAIGLEGWDTEQIEAHKTPHGELMGMGFAGWGVKQYVSSPKRVSDL